MKPCVLLIQADIRQTSLYLCMCVLHLRDNNAVDWIFLVCCGFCSVFNWGSPNQAFNVGFA